MKSSRPIRPRNMKIRTAHLLLLLVLCALVGSLCGCATDEPDNASVRPWNSPEGWQGGALDGMGYQHR
jgi:hypothetical protein